MDKIICLGKNYGEHAKEMGERLPEKPVIFLKPASVLTSAQQGETLQIPYPAHFYDLNLHHELEIVLEIQQGGFCLSEEEVIKGHFIQGVTLGLDMTKRDLQGKLKKEGHPWTLSKVFPHAAIIGPWKKVQHHDDLKLFQKELFTLEINGELRQQGRMEEMLLPPLSALSYISQYFPLCPGDLVFTGTPSGVGKIQKGDCAHLSWGDQKISYQVAWE